MIQAQLEAYAPWVFVPARLESTRLPRKPLLDLEGAPLIARVVEAVTRAVPAPRVVVVSDAQEVLEASMLAEPRPGHALLITEPCASGSERVALAYHALCDRGVIVDVTESAWLINVQGDEPLLPAESLTRLIGSLAWFEARGVSIVTLAAPLMSDAQHDVQHEMARLRADRGCVKACLRAPEDSTRPELREALYFTRSPTGEHLHIGVYAIHQSALSLVREPRGPLSRLEDLEQLAWMERGARVGVVCLDAPHPPGVDTPADLARTRAFYQRALEMS